MLGWRSWVFLAMTAFALALSSGCSADSHTPFLSDTEFAIRTADGQTTTLESFEDFANEIPSEIVVPEDAVRGLSARRIVAVLPPDTMDVELSLIHISEPTRPY